MHAYFISLSARSRETKQVNKDRIDTENILSLCSTLCWCCNYGTVLGPPPSLRADSFFAQKLAQNKSDWWRDARDHRIACVPSVSTQVFCAKTCREREPKILFSSGSNFGTLTRAEAFATKANHRKGERRETFRVLPAFLGAKNFHRERDVWIRGRFWEAAQRWKKASSIQSHNTTLTMISRSGL